MLLRCKYTCCDFVTEQNKQEKTWSRFLQMRALQDNNLVCKNLMLNI